MENDEKLDSEFRFALDLSEREREQSSTLNTGFDEATATWRVIVRYYGDLYEVERQLPGVQVIPLYHQYGIVRVPQEQLEALAAIPQIQYMEKPKEVYFSLEAGRSASCINLVQESGLTGNGVIVGIADSGIDLTHPAFRRSDGSTRILKLWDQAARPEEGTDQRGPEHYRHGVEWDQEQINAALQGSQEYGRLPGDTGSAHGTAVAGVAAGNGSGSAGRRYRGIAVESPIIFVKLASGGEGFSRTTEVMEALDYIVREAQKADMPAAINLSYGNNNGAHDGNSLFEGYITQLAGVWKNVISIASGNEGDSRHHARVQLASEPQRVQFVIGPGESSLSLQLWKQYTDDFSIFLESPDGSRVLVENTREVRRYELQNALVYVYYGERRRRRSRRRYIWSGSCRRIQRAVCRKESGVYG
ncbi:S8 family serine peptidase [Roseburia sp. AM59-24XD]|uniref:S8 family serine peptidase n=1 Tax=Roseburia sp. AM59-24XD TaxID=2293138 RepID=UPI001314CC16|nr:S8 family serine peptidase [Roseburia sp. AM59-24XD]